jgi:hypothetical protein
LEPGETVNLPVYIKNEGTVGVILNITTENWNPPKAFGNITLDWNREDYVLDSGEVTEAILTLTVSADVDGITSFSFDIIITGTEQST